MTAVHVALLGTMANNLYNACCNLRLCGVAATLFLDGTDAFPMGQPVWEAAPMRLSSKSLRSAAVKFDEWMALSTRHIPNDGRLCVVRQTSDLSPTCGIKTANGVMYEFTGDADTLPTPHSILQRATELTHGLPPDLAQQVIHITISNMHLIQIISTYDVLVASQYSECIMAAMTGKPVRYIVYGADWLHVLHNIDGKSTSESQIFDHILKRADIAHGVFNWETSMRISREHDLAPRWLHCSESIINISGTTAARDRQALRKQLDIDEETFVVFLPSRIDTKIKHTEMLLLAFRDFAQDVPEALLVTAGWGKDLERMAHEFPLKNIRFLDHVMSKPLLFDWMSAADLVVDQFADGAIGSTGREALAVGRPLLAFVDACFQWSWQSPSPILNAASEVDILRWLKFAKANPADMEARGAQGQQWLLSNMNPAKFAHELHLLAAHGAEKTLSYAPVLRTDILDHEMDCPRGNCSVQICRWPWPYTAGLTIANDCEYYTWEHFCTLHSFMSNTGMTPWGKGLGLPCSDSFWLYDDSASGIPWFQGTSFTPSVYAPFLKELVSAGFLDTIHAWGEFDATSSFTRDHALRAADCLAKLALRPEIFSNHGSLKNTQNVGGRFAQEYHKGDVPDATQYHTDILRDLGVRWFWGDEGCTNQFSLHGCGSPLEDDGTYRPDAYPWSGQLLYRNRLRDGQYVQSFRRMRGALPKAPTASTLARQMTPAYLDHLEASRGGTCIYQHLGCWRGIDGKPRPFHGNPLPMGALHALEDLAARYHEKRIWVAPLRVFLRYVHTVQNVLVEPFAHQDWMELKISFLDGELLHDHDLCGLSLLVRSNQPIKNIEYLNNRGQWQKTNPTVSMLDDGRQLVHWPCPELGDFPYAGQEC